MALIALAADKGAPGVTTAAVALGAVWPRPVLVAECDLAGGDLVYRLPGEGGMLNPNRGLLSLAATARRGLRPDQVGEHTQRLVGGLDVLVGLANAEQAQGLTWLWGPLGRAFAGSRPVDVLADCGRLSAASPLLDLLREADIVVLFARPTFEQIAHLRERISVLGAELRGGPPIGVGVIADPRDFQRTLAEVNRIVARDQLPVTVLGGVALDPKGAEMLRGQWGGKLDRSLLVRSAREIAGGLVRRLPAYQPPTPPAPQQQPAPGQRPPQGAPPPAIPPAAPGGPASPAGQGYPPHLGPPPPAAPPAVPPSGPPGPSGRRPYGPAPQRPGPQRPGPQGPAQYGPAPYGPSTPQPGRPPGRGPQSPQPGPKLGPHPYPGPWQPGPPPPPPTGPPVQVNHQGPANRQRPPSQPSQPGQPNQPTQTGQPDPPRPQTVPTPTAPAPVEAAETMETTDVVDPTDTVEVVVSGSSSPEAGPKADLGVHPEADTAVHGMAHPGASNGTAANPNPDADAEPDAGPDRDKTT